MQPSAIPDGRGIYNAPASYNCFVNVCVQTVWNCAAARKLLARCGSHSCFRLVGGPPRSACMLCALRGESDGGLCDPAAVTALLRGRDDETRGPLDLNEQPLAS